ncbi:MAG: type II toxin-antitoxin system RelE/ParE family toxin [Erythrobacter sp.]|nr:MAG: type II toxin-antitoxin system RelE/ParE family toxin [Erythrobacter sp.]
MSGLPFRIRQAAIDDLDSIGAFIRQDNPLRAETFIIEIIDRIETIAVRPRSFRSRDDLWPGLRSALYGKYLVLFVIADGTVEVVRVVHGSRDLDALF